MKLPTHDGHIKAERIERGMTVHGQQNTSSVESSSVHPFQNEKSALALILVSLSTLAVASHGIAHQHRSGAAAESRSDTCDGWVQKPDGRASFTSADNCMTPACGIRFNSGFRSAVNELAFGASSSYGDACGRCFKITPTEDPFDKNFTGPFGNTIVVRVDNSCVDRNPGNASDPHWCAQTVSKPTNKFGMSMHFDLCNPSGASQAFFPGQRLAMLGNYEEVPCTEWEGGDPTILWPGSCMANVSTPCWPAVGCGNEGCAPQ